MDTHGVFLDRAQQLGDARDLLKTDEGYAAATALLAVHTAIALNDALFVQLTGRRSKASDHSKAADATEQACRARSLDHAGIKHLRTLLAKKTLISYSDSVTAPELAVSLAVASLRFQEWALSKMKGRTQ